MGRRGDTPRTTSRETTQGGEELRADCQGARVTLGAQAQQALHPTEAEPARAEEARPRPLRAPEELTPIDHLDGQGRPLQPGARNTLVILDELAGRRIAVTGATGFLGTALVERLLRSVPGCEVVVLVRPGQRNAPAERTRREILRNDCFDRLRGELGDASTTRSPAASTRSPATSDATASRSTRQGARLLASCDIVIHCAAAVTLRRAPRRCRRGEPARSVASRRDVERARGRACSSGRCRSTPAPPHRGLDRLREQRPQGRRRRGAHHVLEIRVEDRLAGRGCGRSPRPCGRGRDESQPRTPGELPQGGAVRARRGRDGAAGGTDRAAASRVGPRPPGRARARPLPGARMARRLRVHEVARRGRSPRHAR